MKANLVSASIINAVDSGMVERTENINIVLPPVKNVIRLLITP